MSVSSNPPTFKVGLTPDEKKLYAQLFKLLDPENTGIITGEKARSTFEKSGLPPPILGEIWQLADQNNLGFLSQFGFCHAMRLIGYTQAGQHPSATLADSPGPLPKFVSLQLPPAAAPQQQQQQPLQPQSTNSSFMQTQPSNLVPQNTTTLQSKPQDPISSISPTDYQRFSQLFIKTTGSATGELGGSQARDILSKAKLPTPTLGQIWSLVDRYNSGKLNLDAFVIAMHLIQSLLSNQINQLPPFLPEGIWSSVQQASASASPGARASYTSTSRQPSHSSVNSQQTTVRHTSTASNRDSFHFGSNPPVVTSPTGEWNVTPTMRQQYESIFNNLDKNKTGELNPEQVASFLMTSKLNQQDLAAVWDLADIQNSGIFTKLEFSIALVLVNKKLSGGELPNVVPDELVQSLQKEYPQAAPTQSQPVQQELQQQPKQLAKAKSTMDDLVDIFSTESSPAKSAQTTAYPNPQLQARTSSSDLSQDLPKVRSAISGSFTPTSSFGQNLVTRQQSSVTSPLREETKINEAPSQPEQRAVSPPVDQSRAINYDALRNVPPPPPKKTLTPYPQQFNQAQGSQPQQGQTSQFQGGNEDLLADPETSGQLSQANSDIANVSNQIKSLATQTTGLHEKKIRAEQELQRILSVKQEIETKLRLLRTSYENEVKQVEQVELNLASAKEETEALRSEASISEAKFNTLSTELNEKQLAMEDLQKQNSSSKEKLGLLNAEIVELETQVAAKTNENQQFSNQVSVKRSQVQVSLVKSQELQQALAALESSNLQFHQDLLRGHEEHERLLQEHKQLISSHAAESERQSQLHQQQQLLHQQQSQLQEQKRSHELRKQKDLEVQQKRDIELQKQKDVELKKQKDHESHLAAAAAAAAAAVTAAGVAVIGHSSSKDVVPEAKIDSTASDVSPEEHPVSSKASDNDQAVEAAGEEPEARELSLEKPTDSPVEQHVQHEQNFSSFTSRTDTTTSSVGTNQDNETPVTSPSNSEFQFPESANAGIAGGLVGMPGVLVGVQRTESLTSSVQNNAALSVRDDNIDEVSDRETLGNEEVDEEEDKELAAKSTDTDHFHVPVGHSERDNDGDKSSSGVGSFEIVSAEDARAADEAETKNFVVKNTSAQPELDEFPPIKELDYDDDDSTAESSNEDNFDDAVDNLTRSKDNIKVLPPPEKEIVESKPEVKSDAFSAPAPAFDFDNAFDDLTPATPEINSNDLFAGDEFEGLEQAREEHNEGYEFSQPESEEEFGFTEGFSSGPVTHTNVPDFGNETATAAQDSPGSDEWEQLFAGFGNAGSAPAGSAPSYEASPRIASSGPPSAALPAVPGSQLATSEVEPSPEVSNDLIEELVGMGFSETVARNALKQENWDLHAATNFLLDNA